MPTHPTMQQRIRETIAATTGHRPEDLEAELFLESDLGIDSIKMVELSQRLALLVPDDQQARFAAEVPVDRIMQVQTVGDLQSLFAPWGVSAAAAPVESVPVENARGAAMPTAPAVAMPVMPAAPATPVPAVAVAAAASASAAADLAGQLFALIGGVTGHRVDDLELDQFLEGDLGIDSIKMVELSQKLIVLVPESVQSRFLAEVPTEQLMQLQTLREIVDLLAPWQGQGLAPSMPAVSTTPEAVAAAGPASVVAASTETLDLLPSQYPFLVSHWAVSTCSLCSRVRLQGPFDAEVARRAWGDLLARHPALRARFDIPEQARSFREYRYEVAAQVEAPELAITDLRHLPAGPAQDDLLTAEVERCVNFQWTLRETLLHRFFAYRLADDLVEVFFTNHHLISDGLSNQQVMREFLSLYATRATGRAADLSPATSLEQYRRIVADIDAWHDPGEERALAEFLRAQGKQAFVWNPGGHARATSRAHVRNHRFRLDAACTQSLLQLTRDLRLPVNALLVGAYLRTVAGFGGDASTLFVNIPTSGRLYPGVDASGVVGCFAQNLALDFPAPAAGEDWSALLVRVQQRIEHAIGAGYDRAQTRQVAQFARDRIALENGRIPEAHTGMFRAGMKSNLFLPYIGNTHIDTVYGTLRVLDYQAATVTNAGTLDTVIELFHGQLEMTTNYDANHYDAAFVARVAEAFLAQLRALAGYRPQATLPSPKPVAPAASGSLQPDQVRQVAEEIMHRPLTAADMGKDLEADLGLDSLERIRIVARLERFLPDVDRKALLGCRSLDEMVGQVSGAPGGVEVGANDEAAMPYRQVIAQCRRTPQAVAVRQDGVELTYAELHRQSNQLAQLLRAQGVTRGSLVGVMMPRGIHLQIALLAILKAGGAYVPLDPDYPSARLGYMLEHARIQTLLTETSVAPVLARCLTGELPLQTLVHLDRHPAGATAPYRVFGRDDWQRMPDTDLAPVSTPDDPMVVLYTSGSTGKPKGVVLGHRGYANRHDWHQQLFRLQPGERVAQKTSICFDISVWELFWPLQHGGTVCPVSTQTLRDPWALAQWIRDAGIQVMHFVPSLFGEFLNAVEAQTIAFPQLRQLVFSGEALPVAHVRRWFARFGLGAALANLYGPTEASIDVSAWQMTDMPGLDMVRVPIGRAMPNVHLRVLDEQMRPVPAGTPGELWIGGVQLAHGYLHDPQRTAEAFRPNPFPEIPGALLYRTGDVAVQLPDGSFDYRGRVDSQVKIRGYRVELGEIEAVLGTHAGVREVAVLALDPGDGQLRLSAWLSGQPAEPRELREFLAGSLPAYMLPQRFEWLDSLPKNQNGKIDRKAIAQLAGAQGQPAAARNAVAELEERIVSNDLDYPVGPAQHWLLTYFEPPYQWAGFSRFRYRQPLDIELFNRALGCLVKKHAALRSVFERRGGSWHQHFPMPRMLPQAEVYDGSQVPADLREQQLRSLITAKVQGLRLDGSAPLWSVIVIKEAEDRFDICVIGHHIISDMLGNGVLFKDLWRLYSDCLAGREPVLEEETPFVSYLESLQKLRSRDSLGRYVDYWMAQFPASDAAFTVPFDHHTGSNSESSTAVEKFALSEHDASLLQQARQRHGASLYNLLLAPLYRALAEWSGRSRVTVSHRVHGRDLGDGRRYFESVGNFAVNYPLAVSIPSQGDWGTLVQSIRSGLESVPLSGVSYDLVAENLPAHLYPDDKLTPVRANYLGNRDLPRSDLFEFDASDWDQRFALPEQKRSTLIEVFFIAGSGPLQVELSYSTHFHRADTIRRIGERYLALLRELLASAPAQMAAAAPAPVRAATSMPAIAAPLAGGEPAGTMPLAGKVAIVTGAGRGIGRDIAATLARQGAQVALVSRTRSNLEEALREVRMISPGHLAIAADVTVQADVEAMVSQVVGHFGGIDILINNAGANRAMLLAESDPKDWREILDINLMATYLCCRSALPHMLTRGHGKVVNLSSAAGVIGYPLFSAYTAAKHGIIGLTKALAEEVKQQNVQVNVVCPAFVDTRMTPQAFRNSAMPTSQVADVIAFLASSLSDGVTGESINIFGKQDMYSFGSEKLGVFKSMTRDFKPGVTA